MARRWLANDFGSARTGRRSDQPACLVPSGLSCRRQVYVVSLASFAAVFQPRSFQQKKTQPFRAAPRCFGNGIVVDHRRSPGNSRCRDGVVSSSASSGPLENEGLPSDLVRRSACQTRRCGARDGSIAPASTTFTLAYAAYFKDSPRPTRWTRSWRQTIRPQSRRRPAAAQ